VKEEGIRRLSESEAASHQAHQRQISEMNADHNRQLGDMRERYQSELARIKSQYQQRVGCVCMRVRVCACVSVLE